jgi:hypothetical protein
MMGVVAVSDDGELYDLLKWGLVRREFRRLAIAISLGAFPCVAQLQMSHIMASMVLVHSY